MEILAGTCRRHRYDLHGLFAIDAPGLFEGGLPTSTWIFTWLATTTSITASWHSSAVSRPQPLSFCPRSFLHNAEIRWAWRFADVMGSGGVRDFLIAEIVVSDYLIMSALLTVVIISGRAVFVLHPARGRGPKLLLYLAEVMKLRYVSSFCGP